MGNIDQIRTVLNVIFMIGAAASFILYFSLGEDKTIFFLCMRRIAVRKDDGVCVPFLSTLTR